MPCRKGRRHFHPLKAGRRPEGSKRLGWTGMHFHPLKAGRRQVLKDASLDVGRISIPSRRVGDFAGWRGWNDTCPNFHPLKAGRRPGLARDDVPAGLSFPSPQGGSETLPFRLPKRRRQTFPSPQGGSETNSPTAPATCCALFPSPQGGSETRKSMCGS